MSATMTTRRPRGKYLRQRAFVRALCPAHATKWLQREFDVSQRTAQSYVLGERPMHAEDLARLLIECGPDAERRVLRLIMEMRRPGECET